jgi:hypothetical protein
MSGLIECDGCGRSFTSDEPVAMIAAIKGPCPSCGGSFRLRPLVAAAPSPVAQRPPAHGR